MEERNNWKDVNRELAASWLDICTLLVNNVRNHRRHKGNLDLKPIKPRNDDPRVIHHQRSTTERAIRDLGHWIAQLMPEDPLRFPSASGERSKSWKYATATTKVLDVSISRLLGAAKEKLRRVMTQSGYNKHISSSTGSGLCGRTVGARC